MRYRGENEARFNNAFFYFKYDREVGDCIEQIRHLMPAVSWIPYVMVMVSRHGHLRRYPTPLLRPAAKGVVSLLTYLLSDVFKFLFSISFTSSWVKVHLSLYFAQITRLKLDYRETAQTFS